MTVNQAEQYLDKCEQQEKADNNKTKDLTLEEIESYGSDIQNDISESISELLQETKCIDLGTTGKYLAELSETSNQITKRLDSKGLMKYANRAKNFLVKFDSIDSRIETLEGVITNEKDKLNNILNGLYKNRELLLSKQDELKVVHQELEELIQYLKENITEDTNGLKLQAATHRLKVIATTESIVHMESEKTILVIQENKEIANQLMEASDNLIPMFKTMMMNILATRANSEAIKLKKQLSKTANKLIVENAKQIEENAESLIQGREDTLIDIKSLTEANNILQRTLEKVIKSAKNESSTNLEMIQRLKESKESMTKLLREGDL